MVIQGYDETYLEVSQKILGDMLDFAVNTCDMSPVYVMDIFIASRACRQFEKGNPRYIAGMTGCELLREIVLEKTDNEIKEEDAMYLDKSPEYWAGWILAYYQWKTGRNFAEILKTVPIEELLDLYNTLHEVDADKAAEVLDYRFKMYQRATRLKEARKNIGFSQSELAERSEVSIRQIQLFEQRQRDINKAQAMTILALARALNCRMEDLIEI